MEMMLKNGFEDLSTNEIQNVNGGFLPLIALPIVVTGIVGGAVIVSKNIDKKNK